MYAECDSIRSSKSWPILIIVVVIVVENEWLTILPVGTVI